MAARSEEAQQGAVLEFADDPRGDAVGLEPTVDASTQRRVRGR
jgi:hypothetical protein